MRCTNGPGSHHANDAACLLRSPVVACFCGMVLLAGCGGSTAPTAPTPAATVTQENLAGTWTATVGGVTQGVTLDGTLTVTLEQSAGALSGGYSMVGTLTNPAQTSPVQGSVTLTGTVAPGANPAVSITTRSVQCPQLPTETWSGSYGSRDGAITLTGTAHIITQSCAIVLSYPQTIRLTR